MADEKDLTDGLPLQAFAADYRALDAAAFLAKHGSGFLVHEGPLQARRPMRPQMTVMLEKAPIFDIGLLKKATPMAAMVPGLPIAVQDALVFPVHSTGRSPYPSMVTVGRTRNNDIVVADVAISKFHAFFKQEGGRMLLHDAGSRNGTFLNGTSVPDSKHGKPLEVGEGARVRFGEIEFHFVTGAQLRALVALAK